ncbi:MAG TPA: hypothetical protein VFD18_02130 [Chthoniobacterales bacterium]|nr:hypothetical protein [Chthoniobacterales bacterium]
MIIILWEVTLAQEDQEQDQDQEQEWMGQSPIFIRQGRRSS